MSSWPAILGVMLVAFTLREVFRDLFHPASTGSLSDFVARGTFNLFRHLPAFLTDAAPLAIVLVIFIWVLSVCVGFALVYWTLPPTYFHVQAGQRPVGFLSMVYFSLEILSTLGLGDYAPIPIWLRLTVTLEALIGFGLLTASISSIVLVHLALGRVRSLSRRISQLMRAEFEYHRSFKTDGTEQLLLSLSSDLARTRVDFVQHPLVYYFYSDRHHAALPTVLPYVAQLAESGLSDTRATELRRAATVLQLSLQDLADTLRERFVAVESRELQAVLSAYARHHQPLKKR